MICSSIHSKFDIDLYPTLIQEAIRFFREEPIGSLEPGEYEINGRKVYYQVIDLETKAKEEGRPEVHKKYIDIQFLYSGKEMIGFVDDHGKNVISEDLLETRDLLFYRDVENMKNIAMEPGDFCVFFPNDVHMPGCALEEKSMIRKVVYKIDFDFYKQEFKKEVANERS